MNTQHTPGPWKSTVYHNSENGDTRIEIESAGQPYRICRVHLDNTANARLIAAAPELLEALENLYRHCAMIHSQWGEGSNQREADAAIAAGHAAIAKATKGD